MANKPTSSRGRKPKSAKPKPSVFSARPKAPRLKIFRGTRRKPPSSAAATTEGAPALSAPAISVSSRKVVSPRQLTDLPSRYNEDTLVLLPRDPFTLYAYWELREETAHRARAASAAGRAVLRVFDVSEIDFNGFNAHRQFDVQVSLDAGNWYVQVPVAGRTWLAEIGFVARDGRFASMRRSNAIALPPDTFAREPAAHFVTIRPDVPLRRFQAGLLRKVAEGKALSEEERQKLFAMSAGLRLSLSREQIEQEWRERIRALAGASRAAAE